MIQLIASISDDLTVADDVLRANSARGQIEGSGQVSQARVDTPSIKLRVMTSKAKHGERRASNPAGNGNKGYEN